MYKSYFSKAKVVSIGLLFLLFLNYSFSANAQQVKLSFKDTPLKIVLKKLSKQTGYSFAYSDALKQVNANISCEINSNESINQILSTLLENKGINFTILGKQIILAPDNVVIKKGNQKVIIIKGSIKDDAGEVLPGVTIVNKSNSNITSSDINGNYSIEAKEGDLLSFSSIGMENYEQMVRKQESMNIIMIPNAITLDNVVITGYQTLSKERSAGAYTVIGEKKIESKLQTNILNRLEGMVSGMSMYKGKPIIRGTSTIYANNNPLYVVDGVPFEGNIETINPNDIANISVLKDATAASIYGARSTNGVIVITTKNGTQGKLNVNYNATISISPLPDRDYSNLMSSSEFIDYQIYMFNKGVKPTTNPSTGVGINEVMKLLFQKRSGVIDESNFNSQINKLRSQDRYDQVKDEFLNTIEVSHQHNLSFNGGSDFYKYSFSLNYMGVNPYEKGKYKDRIGFNVKNKFNFTKWCQVDLGIMGSDVNDEYNDGIQGMDLLNSGGASYNMLRDENGNANRWDMEKNLDEINRLKSKGLLDESYYAVNELNKVKVTNRNQYININFGAKVNIIKSLNAEFRYKTERENSYFKRYWTKDAYKVKNMINNATVIAANGTITNHIPMGGQVSEINGNKKSYTLRAQLNYSEIFADKHDVKVLVGAERRKVYNEQNGHYRFGYDDYNLSYKNIDEVQLRKGIMGTQALYGKYTLYDAGPEYRCIDDRYVSFYGNASYTYNNKLSLNASIRIDQSNLFGTDPKYQYRPLWSIGANYTIFTQNDVKWIDRLSARATYGINGNVYTKSGPFIISQVSRLTNWNTNETYATIISPPNSALRWEKTKTMNFGLDFALLSHRLQGSIEYYNKRTSDMLGNRAADPTTGWQQLLVNYGKMRNSGIEIVLESVNIATKNFQWNTSILFSYNANKLIEIEDAAKSAYSYYGRLQARKGKPFNSLYSIRWAGLDKEGNPQAYKADGTIVNNSSMLDANDLVYSGTYNPPYNTSFSNSFRYKNLELSFMFIYYGGHVMRDVAAGYYHSTNRPYETEISNIDKVHGNFWRQPGDENNPDIGPAYKPGVSSSLAYIWYAADKHIQKADYVKLRDLSLSYYFPKQLISKAKISDLRVIFQAQNIWRWSANKNNLDPEVWTSPQLTYASRGTAIPPTFTFGLNISF